MTQLWDSYYYTSSGGDLVFGGSNGTGVTVTDTTSNDATVSTGDTIDDSANDTGSYIGTVVINGVTAFVVDAGGGYYSVYVPAGTSINEGTTPAIPDNSGAWDLAQCFMAGTMLATPDGERAVETLVAGDLVLTADGTATPVLWLGRSTRARLFSDPVRVLPIRIQAGALGENLPARDLLLSPGHAVLVDGVLVHAAALINGTTIVHETNVEDVFTYYHVETGAHDLLLAEGVASESFLAGVEDITFDNWADRPADRAVPMEMAYPRVKAPRQLPASVRTLLAARAAAITPDVAIAA